MVPVSSADAGSVLRSGTADFNEIEDRCARANNIIVYGIDKSKTYEVKKRIRHDEVRFRAILSSIDVPADGDFKPIRIGNENVRARLIKIVFMDPSMVSKCMRQKKN